MAVDHDVVTIELEAVFIVNHDGFHRDQLADDGIVDLFEESIDSLFSKLRDQIQLHRPDAPLQVVSRPIFCAVLFLLYRRVRQMHGGVVQIGFGIAISRIGEAGKSAAVNVDDERSVRSDQDIDPQIELLVADQQRIRQILLDHIRFHGLLLLFRVVALCFFGGNTQIQ